MSAAYEYCCMIAASQVNQEQSTLPSNRNCITTHAASFLSYQDWSIVSGNLFIHSVVYCVQYGVALCIYFDVVGGKQYLKRQTCATDHHCITCFLGIFSIFLHCVIRHFQCIKLDSSQLYGLDRWMEGKQHT